MLELHAIRGRREGVLAHAQLAGARRARGGGGQAALTVFMLVGGGDVCVRVCVSRSLRCTVKLSSTQVLHAWFGVLQSLCHLTPPHVHLSFGSSVLTL